MNVNIKSRTLQLLTGIFYVTSAAIIISFTFVMQTVIDFAAVGDLNGLFIAIAIGLALIPVNLLFSSLARRLQAVFVKQALMDIKHKRMAFILSRKSKSPAYEESKDASFFTADTDILENSYLNSISTLPRHIATFVFALGAMIWINWIITVVAALVSLLPVLVSGLFAKGLSQKTKGYSEASAEYVDTVVEFIDGKKDIVAYDKQDVFLKKHGIKNNKVELARLKRNFLSFIATEIARHLGLLVQITVIGLSSYFIVVGDMTFGFMIAIVNLINYLLAPVHEIVTAINGIRAAKPILEKSNEEAEKETANTVAVDAFKHTLELKNLTIRYADEEPVIKDLNLTFKKGAKYAICAFSGYGKSSIARAMALEFTEFGGSITLDGTDIRQIKTKDYHKILHYIRQVPHLFSDTALNNITFFEELTNKPELNNILNLTKTTEFMPDEKALAREVSNTSGLSGGQKQRIVLTRALLHKPQILVLDEITSGIDVETSCAILSELFKDKELTCIAITHESDETFLSLFDEVIHLQ